jgi:molybdopterin/thiamine biosynthesis adenylyltransferase
LPLDAFDFVLRGTDSLNTKFEISQRCQSSKVPFVVGSIYRNTSQVYVFPNMASTINMSDLFGSADSELAEQSCSAVGVYAHQCMFTASIMVSECIKTIIFGQGQALMIQCNLSTHTMTSAPLFSMQYALKADTDPTSSSLVTMDFEPDCLDLKEVNECLAYDVRDKAEFEAKLGRYRNLPAQFVIHATNYDEFKGAVFVCASGKRAKLVAIHVNEITGSNTARYGVQF